MKTIAAIRTNKWTEEEERLLATLQPVFGEHIAVVFHDRNDDVVPPVAVIDINSAWVDSQKLRSVRDWGWRCGDYFYYALRAARPDYDYYWLIEPDVVFTGPAKGFFERANKSEADVLGVNPGPFEDREHNFLRAIPEMEPFRAIFALTRFSGRALDRLFALRQENSKIDVGPRYFTNDELFTFSHAQADPALRIEALESYAPDWFNGSVVTTDPDMLVDTLLGSPELSGKVFHPARSKMLFKRGLANRLSARVGFVSKISDSLQHLSDDDLQDVANMSGEAILNRLRHVREGGHAAKRRRGRA